MPKLLTPEEVVKRIATECVVTDNTGTGISVKRAAAIVKAYGEQERGAVMAKRRSPLGSQQPR